MKPPVFEPITPIKVSERWFPKGRRFGLYECGGRVAPNVTSILSWKFPFDKAKWKKSEPDIDHDAVTRESAKRGTAVHLAMEKWLQSEDHTPVEEHLQWINPLQRLVSRASKTLAVEVPLHHSIDGVGAYAGSCDGLMLVNDDVVLIDYKTKRHGKNVLPKFCEQQRLQLAAYSLAISHLYEDQLPAPIREQVSCLHILRMANLSQLFLPKATCSLSINKSGLIFWVSGMRFTVSKWLTSKPSLISNLNYLCDEYLY